MLTERTSARQVHTSIICAGVKAALTLRAVFTFEDKGGEEQLLLIRVEREHTCELTQLFKPESMNAVGFETIQTQQRSETIQTQQRSCFRTEAACTWPRQPSI